MIAGLTPPIEALFHELRGALRFGRAHVALIVDGAAAPALQRQLTEYLEGQMEIVCVPLAGRQEPVADSLEEAIREARGRHVPPREGPIAPDPPQATRMALLLPDALAVPATSLRTLSELTSRLGMHQRLVLLVDRDASPDDDPARTLAGRLGVGISKIELEPPRLPTTTLSTASPAPTPDPKSTPAAVPRPPAIERPRRRQRPIPVRARPRAGGRRLRTWVALTAIVGGAFVAAPGIIRHLPTTDSARQPSPLTERRPTLARELAMTRWSVLPPKPVEPELAKAEVVDDSAAISDVFPSLPPVGVPRLEPPASPESAPEPAAAPAPPVAPAPIRIGVNFNAVPWADLEVDGRKIGPTPIANLRLTPGEHEVRASFPDGRIVNRSVHVDALQNRFRIDSKEDPDVESR
jgi:hypothetical protein